MSGVAELKGRHEVTLGRSLTSPNSKNQHVGLRFNFQPGTMDRTRDAYLSGGPSDYTVAVPNSGDPHTDHLFTGALQATKDIDCVLIYDEATSSYRLERLEGMVRLDHQRGKSGHRKTTSSASLASPFVPYNAAESSPAHIQSTSGTPAELYGNTSNALPSSPPPPAVATPAAAQDDLNEVDLMQTSKKAGQAHSKRAAALSHGRQNVTSTPPPRIRLDAPAATPGAVETPRPAPPKQTKGVAKLKKPPGALDTKGKGQVKAKPQPKTPVIAVQRVDSMEDEIDYEDDSDDALKPVKAPSKPPADAEEDDDDDLDDLANMLESTLEESPPDSGRQAAHADESSEDED